ncbi:unnamed protein product [Dibothriocephalus latus]|uniref:Uncharacterized protein n=1 Tax=Dibothriocephalus latus TaxID=60516 RepID=A0A3P7LRB3_DIBLA|nr:unnamed protein product [Dibothriocephalus latus]
MEAERRQLQEELDRRLAECNSAHSKSIAELESARDALTVKLTDAETRSTQLGTELDAMTQRFRTTDRFLNEQLQEREQEREEFQTRIDLLSGQIDFKTRCEGAALNAFVTLIQNVIAALKRAHASSPTNPLPPKPTENGFLTPDSSQVKPNSPGVFKSSPDSLPEPQTERMRPSVRHAINGSWQDTSSNFDAGSSDVDDALSFELSVHPRRCSSPSVAPTLEIRPSTVNHQRSSVLSPQSGESKTDACVGDSSVKYVDTGVSPMALPRTSEIGQSAKRGSVCSVPPDISPGNSALNLSLEMRHTTLMDELVSEPVLMISPFLFGAMTVLSGYCAPS